MVGTAVKDGPPTDTEETYGTIVGDTKGAALRLDGVAISRGASPLLKNINWSIQPNERWGIVGVNGAGKSTLLGAITGTVRMDEGHAFVHANARVGYLKQSVSVLCVEWSSVMVCLIRILILEFLSFLVGCTALCIMFYHIYYRP